LSRLEGKIPIAEPAAPQGSRPEPGTVHAMRVIRFEVNNLRIIESAQLEPGSNLNLVVGANASGKTSLLEAIHLVCTGRSFRSRRADEFIRRGAAETTIHARIKQENDEIVAVGVEKRPHGTRIRFAESDIRSASILARHLPLIVIPPDSQRLVFDGADLRRRLLDWGLFHVEQEYAGVFANYRRVLQQRNAQLRSGPDPQALEAWDVELEAVGGRLHAVRQIHLQRVLPRVSKLASELARVEVSVHYYPGWDENTPLARALASSLPRDLARGYTGIGPHRADLALRVGALPAHQVLSRGEAKLLCMALWLAQARDHHAQSGRSPIILIDDLAAELDPENRPRVLDALFELGAQSFVTSVSERLLGDARGPLKGFHVERGKVREMV